MSTPLDPDGVRELGAHMRHDGFVDAVIRGTRPGMTPPWQRVRIRPVAIAAGRRQQCEHRDGRRTEAITIANGATTRRDFTLSPADV